MKKNLSTLHLNDMQRAVLEAFTYDEASDSFQISDQNGSGYQVRWWGRDGIHAERLYFQTARRDTKAYIQFADAALCTEPDLRVYVDNPGQPRRWIESQTAIMRDCYFPALAGIKRVLAEAATKLPAPSFRDHAEDAEFTTPNLPVVTG